MRFLYAAIKKKMSAFSLLIIGIFVFSFFNTTSTYAAINDGLVSFWSLDESSGTRADSVGSNNLTPSGTVNNNTGKIGSAAQFQNGVSGYLQIANNSTFNMGGGDFSISVWAYLDNKTGTQVFASKYSDGGYAVYYEPNYPAFVFSTYAGGGVTRGNDLGDPNTGAWYHIVGIHDSVANTNTIRINNQYEDTNTSVTDQADTTGPFVIGAFGGSGQFITNGRVDAVGLWNRKLTSGEITALYNSGNGIELSGTPTPTPTSTLTPTPTNTPTPTATATPIPPTNTPTPTHTPTPTSAPATISNISAIAGNSTVTITWNTNQQSSTQVEYGLVSSYGSTTAETDTSPRVTSHSVSLSSLQSCARYFYRVKSINASSLETVSSQQTFTTTGCTTSSITGGSEENVPTSGGTVTLVNGGSTATVEAPSGFSGETTIIQINKLSTNSTPSAPNGKNLVGQNFYDLLAITSSGNIISDFTAPVTFTINYDSNVENSFKEDTLDIYKYTGTTWDKKNCTLDTNANTLTCTLSSFSVYGFFGDQKESSSNQSSSSPGITTYSCTDTMPEYAPDLFQINTTGTKATVYFSPVQQISDYFISYGENSSAEQHGVLVGLKSEGVQQFSVELLTPNTTYYFKVRGQRGCMPGDWSNSLEVKTNNRVYYKNMLTRALSILSPIENKSNTSNTKKISDLAKKPVNSCTYIVKSGDSLWNIAHEKLGNGLLYESIMKSNNLSSTVLQVGQTLKVGCN